MPAENYSLEASFKAAIGSQLIFDEKKKFHGGLEVDGQFRVDFESTHVTFPEKSLDVVYIRPGECVGSINVQGQTFCLSSTVTLSRIRNILVGAERIWVEDLAPNVDTMDDLSRPELEALQFFVSKATAFLDVRAMILIGSRADRTHGLQSDFDVVIDGAGGALSWKLLGDVVRNEAPTLVGVDIIDAGSIRQQSFLNSVYSQGRFFYGPA
jgi:hypothetical protein